MPLAGKNVFDFLISAITTTIHYDSPYCRGCLFSLRTNALRMFERVWPTAVPVSTRLVTIFHKNYKKY